MRWPRPSLRRPAPSCRGSRRARGARAARSRAARARRSARRAPAGRCASPRRGRRRRAGSRRPPPRPAARGTKIGSPTTSCAGTTCIAPLPGREIVVEDRVDERGALAARADAGARSRGGSESPARRSSKRGNSTATSSRRSSLTPPPARSRVQRVSFAPRSSRPCVSAPRRRAGAARSDTRLRRRDRRRSQAFIGMEDVAGIDLEPLHVGAGAVARHHADARAELRLPADRRARALDVLEADRGREDQEDHVALRHDEVVHHARPRARRSPRCARGVPARRPRGSAGRAARSRSRRSTSRRSRDRASDAPSWRRRACPRSRRARASRASRDRARGAGRPPRARAAARRARRCSCWRRSAIAPATRGSPDARSARPPKSASPAARSSAKRAVRTQRLR